MFDFCVGFRDDPKTRDDMFDNWFYTNLYYLTNHGLGTLFELMTVDKLLKSGLDWEAISNHIDRTNVCVFNKITGFIEFINDKGVTLFSYQFPPEDKF